MIRFTFWMNFSQVIFSILNSVRRQYGPCFSKSRLHEAVGTNVHLPDECREGINATVDVSQTYARTKLEPLLWDTVVPLMINKRNLEMESDQRAIEFVEEFVKNRIEKFNGNQWTNGYFDCFKESFWELHAIDCKEMILLDLAINDN